MSATRKTSQGSPAPSKAKAEPKGKKASGGRRTTTPRPDEMSADVLEFITAIDEYKRIHQRPFPTWSEVLEIIKTLGYSRADDGSEDDDATS